MPVILNEGDRYMLIDKINTYAEETPGEKALRLVEEELKIKFSQETGRFIKA